MEAGHLLDQVMIIQDEGSTGTTSGHARRSKRGAAVRGGGLVLVAHFITPLGGIRMPLLGG